MTGSYWRAHAAKVISEVLAATKDLKEPQIRAALRDAYPFGERRYHPYKIWCDEVRRQRGLKTSESVRDAVKAGQSELF